MIQLPRPYALPVHGPQSFEELTRQMSAVDSAIIDILESLKQIAQFVNRQLALASTPPAIVFGTVAGTGISPQFVRSDATLAIFTTSTPAVLGAVGATGSAAFAARVDHVHKSETPGDWYASANGKGLVTKDAQGTARYWRISVTNGTGNPTGGATLTVSSLGNLSASRDGGATGNLLIRIDDVGTTPP